MIISSSHHRLHALINVTGDEFTCHYERDVEQGPSTYVYADGKQFLAYYKDGNLEGDALSIHVDGTRELRTYVRNVEQAAVCIGASSQSQCLFH